MFFFFRILWKKNEVADYEATTFSIFYNNALFLVLVVGISFYVLRSFTAPLYPFLSDVYYYYMCIYSYSGQSILNITH